MQDQPQTAGYRKPLFIFEMANNHQGDVDHGLRIIQAMAELAERYDIPAAVKLQYRDLDTFIRPDFRGRTDVKHVGRFESTRLTADEFQTMIRAIKAAGMKAVVTPFDEASVERCLDHGVDVIKIASASVTDWPLLEEIAQAGKPVIFSTGGVGLADIDRVVTFFEHRGVEDLSILHCVGIYPTDNADQRLGFMRRMQKRYPHCTIGYSGHESPDNVLPGRAVAAMGAEILERHVGVPTDEITLNKYSMNPEQAAAWIEAVLETLEMVGTDGDKVINEAETASLLSLRRGVFAAGDVAEGDTLDREHVYFAFPAEEGQTTTSDWHEGMTATRAYKANEPLTEARERGPIQEVRAVVHEAKGMLREAGIATGEDYEVELSHHYGMERFREVGAVIVNFFNREYCKKLILLLPGQRHPLHSHKSKEETFQVLYGDMELSLDGETTTMRPGDLETVKRGQVHAFKTDGGVIFEEVSTTHIKGDSYYEDEAIARLDPIERKTVISQW